jgi:predicted PurR-regulated permease PerM
VTKNVIKFYCGVLLSLVSANAAAAESSRIQHDIEVFLSSGAGMIVLILLLFLLLLWLLLPLAVFGLKSRLKEIVQEQKETNRMLSDIKNELAAVNEEDAQQADIGNYQRPGNESPTMDTYKEIRY